MPRKRYTAEKIIGLLRQAEVELAKGRTVGEVSLTIGQPRSTQRKLPRVRGDEAALTVDIVTLATKYGRYGYWRVNAKRVQRIWRREGLKVPKGQPKRGACGSTTAPSSGCGRTGPTMSGPMTSWRPGPMMAGRSGC